MQEVRKACEKGPTGTSNTHMGAPKWLHFLPTPPSHFVRIKKLQLKLLRTSGLAFVIEMIG